MTLDELGALVPQTQEHVRLTPILLEVPATLRMSCLRRTILDLLHHDCVNLAFLVCTPRGDAAIPFPVINDACSKLQVYDGPNKVVLVENQDTLEVIAKIEPGGAIQVTGLTSTREYVVFQETWAGATPDRGWKGSHPPYGIWSVSTLKSFLARPDVVAVNPYVGLEVSWQDSAADLVRCLASLRLAAGSRVEPQLRAD